MISLRPLRLCDKISHSGFTRSGIAGWMHALGEAFGDLVFPWECPVCGAEESSGPFCRSCRRELLEQSTRAAGSACLRCASPVGPFADWRAGCAACRGRPLGFDAVVALGPYEGTIRDLCLRLKHEQDAWLASWLSDLLVESRREAIERLAPNACIVPVPLHWSRRWRRGYNQADELARGMARRLKLRVRRPLRRVVATEQLALMGPTARSEVMHGAFRARSSSCLTGRTVLLVDDVLTTGATCGEAAKALKRAGAARVVALVIARAERTTP
jgi:ComF family protein